MKVALIILGIAAILSTLIVMACMRVSGMESQREYERELEEFRNGIQSK